MEGSKQSGFAHEEEHDGQCPACEQNRTGVARKVSPEAPLMWKCDECGYDTYAKHVHSDFQ